MRPLYIFDLDGTLALIEHRLHFIQRPSLKCYDCGGANRKNCVQCSDLDAGWKADWRGFFRGVGLYCAHIRQVSDPARLAADGTDAREACMAEAGSRDGFA